jgi:hypothetical protein
MNDALADRVKDQLHRGVKAQLSEDIAAMSLDGVRTDVECSGDLFVGFAFGNKLKDFALAHGEELIRILNTFLTENAHVVFGKKVTNSGAEERFALGNGVDGEDKVRACRVLKEVSEGSGLERAHYIGFVGMHAEDDNGGGR